jgi:hypothetical protein
MNRLCTDLFTGGDRGLDQRGMLVLLKRFSLEDGVIITPRAGLVRRVLYPLRAYSQPALEEEEMTTTCTVAELAQMYDPTVCYLPPAQPSLVEVFSPFTQKYLVFDNLIVPLGKKLRMILGSDASSCDLVMLGSRVDPHHAMIFYDNGCYFIQDLGSRLGTFVNGRRISGIVELCPGDEITMKPYSITFTDTKPAGSGRAYLSQPAFLPV